MVSKIIKMILEHVDQEISREWHVECWSVNQQQCNIKNGFLGLLQLWGDIITFDFKFPLWCR